MCVCVGERGHTVRVFGGGIIGMSGLQVKGGGVNRAHKIGGGGVGKRAQLTGTPSTR